MQGVELAVRRAGERSNDRRFLDMAGMEMTLDDVVRTLAAALVCGPGGFLAVMRAVSRAKTSRTVSQGGARFDGTAR